MQDSELKRLLQETCPIRPGQETRAWSDLREQLYGAKLGRSSWSWVPAWRVSALAFSGLVALFVAGEMAWHERTPALPLVASSAPNIYATSFYSKTAQAQVVWLNGLEPATDKPAAAPRPSPTPPPDASSNSL